MLHIVFALPTPNIFKVFHSGHDKFPPNESCWVGLIWSPVRSSSCHICSIAFRGAVHLSCIWNIFGIYVLRLWFHVRTYGVYRSSVHLLYSIELRRPKGVILIAPAAGNASKRGRHGRSDGVCMAPMVGWEERGRGVRLWWSDLRPEDLRIDPRSPVLACRIPGFAGSADGGGGREGHVPRLRKGRHVLEREKREGETDK